MIVCAGPTGRDRNACGEIDSKAPDPAKLGSVGEKPAELRTCSSGNPVRSAALELSSYDVETPFPQSIAWRHAGWLQTCVRDKLSCIVGLGPAH